MYILFKDGLWLMAYQPSGHMEIIGDGTLEDVPMCLWGKHICDAMTFDNRDLAAHIAKIVGAVTMKV